MKFFLNKKMYAISHDYFNSPDFYCPVCNREDFNLFKKMNNSKIDLSLFECESCQERVAVIYSPVLDIHETMVLQFEEDGSVKI